MPLIYVQPEKKKRKDKKQNKNNKKPFLVRAEFSKVLTILCILQAQLWTVAILILSIKFMLDSTIAVALLGFIFLGENIAIACYFNKTKLFNATKLKTDSIKEIYKITNDKNKALEELSIVEEITNNDFTETLQEDIESKVNI